MSQGRPVFASLRVFVATVFLVLALPVTLGLAAQLPPGNEAEVNAYLDQNEAKVLERLRTYSRKHAIVSSNAGARFVILSRRVEGVEGNRLLMSMSFRLGQSKADALFHFQWDDDGYDVVGHQTIAPSLATRGAQDTDQEAAPPLRSRIETEAYIERNLPEIIAKLREYNEANQITHHRDYYDNIELDAWHVERLHGDRVFIEIRYRVGYISQKGIGRALFELRWDGGDLAFVDHQKITTRAKITGGPDPGHDGCTFNYYSPRPCLEVMRKWSEFAALHDLPLNEESAAILQAYKQLDYDRGDELMATVKSLAPPIESSIFALQGEVTAMNLPKPGQETDCVWNPYAPNPCPRAQRIFLDFAERHGLAVNPTTAIMFDAYTRGDFKKADVIYALAMDLDVPAYGHIPSVAARDLASRWPEMNRMEIYGGIECEMNPHSQNPCTGVVPLWREFAARYGLEDIPDNGRIFEAYYEGDFETGDTHLAEAFGVPLETLLEASGVPSRDLTIEVYPGWRQMLRDLLVGT